MPIICHIAPEMNPLPVLAYGGVEQVISDMCHRGQHHTYHIICPRHPERPDEEVIDGVHYHRIHLGVVYTRIFKKWTRWDPNSYAKRVARIIDRIKPDVVQVHNRATLMGDIMGFTSHTPKWIFHAHNQIKQPVPKDIDVLTGCSEFIVNDTAETYGLSCRRQVMYNGIDLEELEPGTRATYRGHDFSGKTVVGCVARLSPEKGQDFLIRTIMGPLKHRKDICVLMAGEICKRKDPNEERTKFARELVEASDERVIWLDTVPREEILGAYQACDIYVQPSEREALGLSLLEAMACGKPVIVSDVPGMAEVVGENQWGQRVTYKDKAALAHAIEAWLDDPQLRETWAEKANQRVREFEVNHLVNQVEAFYDDLLGR